MYFPYLRGKQFELALMKELAPYLAGSGKIIPIIEPINTSKTKGFVRTLNEAGAPYALVVNPAVGELKGQVIAPDEKNGLLPHADAFLAMIINRNTPTDSIVTFLNKDLECGRLIIHAAETDDIGAVLEASLASPRSVIHAFIDGDVGQQYIGSFGDLDRVMIRDSFRKADRNADYRDRDGEFFSDSHLTYRDAGFFGFGDYTTIGKPFAKGGINPKVVAVHITYPHAANQSLRIRHFLSDMQANTNGNPEGKLQEALTKMRAFLNADNPCDCAGCAELMAMQEAGSFHGLGLIKKLSIHHHLKTLEALI